MSYNNVYAKSCIRVYNNTAQTVTEEPTPLELEGSPMVNSGCSLTLNPGSIMVNKSGLYHLSADVTFTPSAKGTLVVQLYKNGIALPCAKASDTSEKNNTFTTHVETDLCINTCCINHPIITLVVSGAAGVVNHLCMGALKLA